MNDDKGLSEKHATNEWQGTFENDYSSRIDAAAEGVHLHNDLRKDAIPGSISPEIGMTNTLRADGASGAAHSPTP